MKPPEMLKKFDKYLNEQSLSFEAIVIGGAALCVLGIITRETQDVDVLDPNIPDVILEASRKFSRIVSQEGLLLKEDWLNNGPASLKDVLPPDWKTRLENLYLGDAIQLFTLGRPDLLKSKLFAYCDRGQDLQDCILLNPTQEELREALNWVQVQDAHPGWPDHVKKQFSKLAERLGHGI